MNTLPLFLQELTTPDIPENITNNIIKLVEETEFTCTYCSTPIFNYSLIALYTHPVYRNTKKYVIITSLCPRCNQLHIFYVSLLEVVPNMFIFETAPIHIDAEALTTLHTIQKQFIPPNYETCTPTQFLQAIRKNILIYLSYTVFLNKSTKKFLQNTINQMNPAHPYNTHNIHNITLNNTKTYPAKYKSIINFIDFLVFMYPNHSILQFITKTLLCTPTQFNQYFLKYSPISLDKLLI